MSTPFLRALPDLIVLCVVAVMQALAGRSILTQFGEKWSHRARKRLTAGTIVSVALLVAAFLLRFVRIAQYFPKWLPSWGRGFVIAWALLSVLWVGAYLVSQLAGRFLTRKENSPNLSRRAFLQTTNAVLFAAPPLAIGYGTFIERKEVRLREQKIVVPDLAADLDGIRLVQITDIHRSPFLSRDQLDWAVQMANETRSQVALVTGDLITSGLDPLDDCLDSLAKLRAEVGVFGCMGNHEIYSGSIKHTEIGGAQRGMKFLRQASQQLRFGDATLNLAGVDYQRSRRRYLVGAERLIQPGAYNILLSHNPDVFPVAAQQGYDLTISGHTHGGQIRFEILEADLNIARMLTPYVDGLYHFGKSSGFVSRGLGTIGMPTRIGAPPEVALIHLCRS